MVRLIGGAVVAAAAAGLILVQLRGTAELALWEILIVVLVGLQYRGIPERGDPLEVPLFRLPRPEQRRLPRAVATAELAVVDATTGYLSPDRRLRPVLRRIAEHKLSGHGADLDSSLAVSLLGERACEILRRSGDDIVAVEDLEEVVSGLEAL